MRNFVITSEAVSVGHPDKLCDQISDAIVDGCLAAGQRAGINVECALATGVAFLSIHAAEELAVDPSAIARQVLADAGYGAGDHGARQTVMEDLSFSKAANAPSPGVPAGQMVSAFGYACGSTPPQMPYPIWLAHRLCRVTDDARTSGRLEWISSDVQAQVAVRFADRKPVGLEAVALRFGTRDRISQESARQHMVDEVIRPAMEGAELNLGEETRLITVAADGPAGPMAHSGLTGRKSADDAYGAFIRRAGPSLSGKDPSRIDRIANYAARHAALNARHAGLADEIEVQLSYVAGDDEPISVEVDTYGSGCISDAEISARLREKLDFRVGAIAERMSLWDLPRQRGGRFYRDLAVYGQMGRTDLDAPWEQTEAAASLT